MEDELSRTTNDEPGVNLGSDTTKNEDELTDTLDAFERQAIVKFVLTLGAIAALSTAIQDAPVTPIAALLVGLVTGLSKRTNGYMSSAFGAGVAGIVIAVLTSFVGVLLTLGGSAVFWGFIGALTAVVGTAIGVKIRKRVR